MLAKCPKVNDDGGLCALYSLYSMIKIRRVCSCGLCLVPRTSLVKFTMLLQCVSITEQKLIHLQTRQRGRQVVNSILCTVCTMCTSCCVFFSIASASMIQSVSTYARTCQRVYLWCIMSHHPIFKYKSIKNQMDFCQGKYWYEYF